MIPKQAIEKAIAGGWFGTIKISSFTFNNGDYFFNVIDEDRDEVMKQRLSQPSIVLSSTFWQALGKALGWEECEKPKKPCTRNCWEFYALVFIRLILTGGDVEQFWKELLKEGWSVVESDRTD